MPHVTRRTSAWSLFVAALLVAGPAGAWQQPPLPTPAVKYRLANEAFDAGRFQAALDGFTDCAERAATATLVCRCQGMAGWASRALGESASAIGWFGQFVASCPPEPLPDGEDPAAWRSMRTSIEDQLPAPAVVEELPPSEPAPEPAPAPAEPAPRAGEVELPPTGLDATALRQFPHTLELAMGEHIGARIVLDGVVLYEAPPRVGERPEGLPAAGGRLYPRVAVAAGDTAYIGASDCEYR